jgi:L-fuculose-phosphate aldolase
MIVFAPDLPRALRKAVELEALAQHYCLSLMIGGPHLLTDAEVADASAKFGTYGLREKSQ